MDSPLTIFRILLIFKILQQNDSFFKLTHKVNYCKEVWDSEHILAKEPETATSNYFLCLSNINLSNKHYCQKNKTENKSLIRYDYLLGKKPNVIILLNCIFIVPLYKYFIKISEK